MTVFLLQGNPVLTAQEAVLNKGDKVAGFKAIADDGSVWKSKKALKKSNLVVYFYPAAMTGGCTKQACAYRDDQADLAKLNAQVVGVSGDEVKNLELFKMAHNLNFTLLSDPKGEIAGLFGVPFQSERKSIKREIDGQEFDLFRDVTTSRWTFVLDQKGRVIYKSTEVNPEQDSKAVMEVLKNL
jgi:peroxiredoxin Q/BCP